MTRHEATNVSTPWTVSGHRVRDARNNTIAVYCGDHEDPELVMARLRLIAAAPDLLNALLAVRCPDGGVYGTQRVIAQIDAAIAKATR
jgi:hypothetical protein